MNANDCVQKALPSYKEPPVNEVYCGMRFRTPEKLKIPHFGLLWQKLRSQYSKIEHKPPVEATRGQVLMDSTTGLILPRMWFINEQDNKLVQFQMDQLYFNWRKRGDEYPRYPQIITGFEEVVGIVKGFFQEELLGDLEPVEYQLTYMNHIPKGQGWDTTLDLGRIFKDFLWTDTDRFLPQPTNYVWQARFQLPDSKGNMIIRLSEGTQIEEKSQKLLILELTTKGLVEQIGNGVSMRQWYDVAREWIVRGFTDITTSEMHKIWEREDA